MSDPWREYREFRELHKATTSTGARFWKVDFHFHTPASGKDYRDGGASYAQIAERLRDENFDAVFVTDHNEWKGIRALQDACEAIGARTLVLPGAEVTLKTRAICLLDEGKRIDIVKFHCLALLPPLPDFEDRLRSLITDNHRCPTILDAKPVERVLQQPLEDISDLVRKDWNGIFIPAHINQAKGIEKSRSIDDLYADSITIDLLKNHFDAVEIRKPESEKIFSGSYVTPKNLVVPEMTCVLGSDAHDLSSIGREATWVLCERLTFDEIREALKHRSRVRLALEGEPSARVFSICVDGAFLGKQAFAFPPGMTAFIGSKGSGKTAVLELVRFALGYESQVERGYLTHLLGPAGRVWVEVRAANDDAFLFMRQAASPGPSVYSKDGTQIERSSVIPANFNVEIRGWGETTRLAVEVSEQLRLIDNHDGTGDIRRSSATMAQARADVAGKLVELNALVTEYRDLRAEVQTLSMREATLQRLDAGNFSEKQLQKERRDTERALIHDLCDQVARHKNQIQVRLLSAPLNALFASYEKRRNDGTSTAPEDASHISTALDAVRTKEAELQEGGADAVSALERAVARALELVTARNAPLDEQYQREFADLSVEEQRVLAERNRVVQEISGLEALRGRAAETWSRIRQCRDYLCARLEELQEALSRRSARREQIVQGMNSVLAGSRVGTRMTFLAFAQATGGLPLGATASNAYRTLSTEIGTLGEDDITYKFPHMVGIASAGLNFNVDDGTSIEFEIYEGLWKQASELSAGQKSTAVLPLLLIAATGPIVLDQPEDNLDNKYIGSTVVRMIRDRKARNQIIVTTHSASIVVMSDCELIIEMSDEGNHGRVREAGFLAGPDSAITSSVLDVLDGGREALLTRFKKYGRLMD